MDEERCAGCCAGRPGDGVNRRTLLLGAGIAALAGSAAHADDGDDPNAVAPPKADDLLIQATGGDAGKPIGVDAFTTPNTLIQAWAKDPKTGVVRNLSRLNRILLVKIDPAGMDDATRARSVNGVVAYSDFCVHAGCWIETYHAQENVIICHCHSSLYDPRHGAEVTGGPAKGPLAALSLKLVDGHFVAAAPFVGHLGIIT
ncbi:QcrA and Rieske domain-containing protein [Lichenicoccus roseus]|nr:Rieske 2Fe-2S domain-containing protein [Lichenicoccus roseus]